MTQGDVAFDSLCMSQGEVSFDSLTLVRQPISLRLDFWTKSLDFPRISKTKDFSCEYFGHRNGLSIIMSKNQREMRYIDSYKRERRSGFWTTPLRIVDLWITISKNKCELFVNANLA